MPLTDPNPRTWILRFKHNRTTVVLHIDPLQSLSSVKRELLTALQQTHPAGAINGLSIPQNSADILLARPKDINDLTLGFESIEPSSSSSIDPESDAVVGAGKGKGKAAAVSSKTVGGRNAKAQLKDWPQGAGLRDHGIVAFKFKKVDGDVVISIEEEEDEGIAVAREDMEGVQEEWDVVVPSFEETYGEEP
jgi:hypothetical protein